MLMNDETLTKKFTEEMAKLKREVKKPGILLAGATGVGKSSLVNMVFGSNTAVVGTGIPVTQKIDCYESEDSSVRIYDSKGYEMNEEGDRQFIDDVIGMVRNPTQHSVNIIWYCISALGGRVTDYDLNSISAFEKGGCPIAVVITKADNCTDDDISALRKVISEKASVPIFETSTLLPEVNQINSLVSWSIKMLPEHLQFAFISQQKADFEEKRKRAKIAIAEHVAGAGLVGFIPVPFADAPVLAANEIALMTRLLYLYDLGTVGNAVKGVGIEGLLSIAGKSAVGGLLKLIPGVGQVVGGLINAGVAISITWAFGAAVAFTCERVWKAKLSGKDSEVEDLLNNFGTVVQTMAEENIKAGKTSEQTAL